LKQENRKTGKAADAFAGEDSGAFPVFLFSCLNLIGPVLG
jgi:hypothetical protein